jgi:hypothetical protein
MDTEIFELKLTKNEIDAIIESLEYQKMWFCSKNITNDTILKKFINISSNINDEIKHCPFCGRLPEPELFSHNSIKKDSWFIFCDCGKVSIKDCKTLEDALKEWNKRI